LKPRPVIVVILAQLAHVERCLAVCPVLRTTDLHRGLCAAYGYAGSYWTFLRQVRPLRPAVLREREVRFETLPGVQTQADWKHLGGVSRELLTDRDTVRYPIHKTLAEFDITRASMTVTHGRLAYSGGRSALGATPPVCHGLGARRHELRPKEVPMPSTCSTKVPAERVIGDSIDSDGATDGAAALADHYRGEALR
jgi:transposase